MPRKQRIAEYVTINKICECCELPFTRIVNVTNSTRTIYCSKYCMYKAKRLSKYKITFSKIREFLKSQNNSCAICKKEFTPTATNPHSINIDHCHTTGKTRGLLCGLCNRGLGQFNDNVSFLKEAINYLEQK